MNEIITSIREESSKGQEIVQNAADSMKRSTSSFDSITKAEQEVNAQLEVVKATQISNISNIENNEVSIFSLPNPVPLFLIHG